MSTKSWGSRAAGAAMVVGVGLALAACGGTAIDGGFSADAGPQVGTAGTGGTGGLYGGPPLGGWSGTGGVAAAGGTGGQPAAGGGGSGVLYGGPPLGGSSGTGGVAGAGGGSGGPPLPEGGPIDILYDSCVHETNQAFCSRHGKNCGSVTAADNCGSARTVANCGTCAPPQVCGASGTPNVCGWQIVDGSVPDVGENTCVSETDAALCARAGRNCGMLWATDNCGRSRMGIWCGGCDGGANVDPNMDACVAPTDQEFCSWAGKNCGNIETFSCSVATVTNCGTCAAPQVCGGSGTPNVCATLLDGGTCVQGTGPSALPFAVDAFFNPTGSLGSPQMAAGCPTRAPSPLAGAKCWTATYTPFLDGTNRTGSIEWQYPDNNWGPLDGRVIPAGATKVRFYAWGAVGGEVVKFTAGNGAAATDGFRVVNAGPLTNTPTAYEISLVGVEYTCHSVRMAFSWFSDAAFASTFYIDDIQWQ